MTHTDVIITLRKYCDAIEARDTIAAMGWAVDIVCAAGHLDGERADRLLELVGHGLVALGVVSGLILIEPQGEA